MKKIFTTICLLSSAMFGYSQLQLFIGSTNVTNTTVDVPIVAGSTPVHDVDVHNNNSSSVTYLTKRLITGTSAPDSTCSIYFCTGINCYVPSWNTVFTEPGSGNPLAANATTPAGTGLIAHLDVGATCCDLFIMYKIYNVASGTNDTARVTFHYRCVSGINDLNKIGGTISSAYPNPANEFVSIKYNVNEFSQKGKIVFYDMLGKSVKDVILQDKQGNAKINITDLNSGIYFYSFIVDEKAVITRKLVITSK